MIRRNLQQWLAWQEQLTADRIALGLERVARVWRRLAVPALPRPVLTVAGTNGKGSTVLYLERILLAGNRRVGSYTSPHLIRYNERVRIGGEMVSDEALCEAFAAVERARGEVPLTYFEFGTLGALWLFARHRLDAVVLEVGMGGRLDAVNVVDPDIALITTVGVDHRQWLGNDVESIAREKAGIFRRDGRGIYADRRPPVAVLDRARQLGMTLFCRERDFFVERHGRSWVWSASGQQMTLPPLSGAGAARYQNAAGAVAALRLFPEVVQASWSEIVQGLRGAVLPGRLEIVPGAVTVVFDVAHNSQSVAVLAGALSGSPVAGKTYAVWSMLADKEWGDALQPMAPWVDHWFVGPVSGSERAAAGADLVAVAMQCLGRDRVTAAPNVVAAFDMARFTACPGDRIVVFGSFITVAQVKQQFFAGCGRGGEDVVG